MDEEKDAPLDRSYQVDWLLVGLIRNVAQRERDDNIPASDKHIDIILTIGGMLVAGELVSSTRWINEMRYDTDSETSDDLNDQPNEAASSESANPRSESERRFIHLREAKFYLGGTVIPGEGDGFLWRGKVSSVDGFTSGTLVTRNSSTRVELKNVRINVR
ncbi:MAG: hypothetical protein LC794_06805 [Acidobacteria bacterium]|nr:hypothetical protein [Acidobacteriota bacterium]